MSARGKRLENEMLVTHRPPTDQEPASGGEGGAGPMAATVDRAELRRRLLSAADPRERAAIVRSIQDAFGNEAAEQIIREARVAQEPETPPREPES
jgi:hypothetical protein